MAGKRERQAVGAAFDEIITGPENSSDVLGSVLASDRRRAGRGQQEPAALPPNPTAEPTEAPERMHQEGKPLTSQPASELTSLQSDGVEEQGTEALEEAAARTEDPATASASVRSTPRAKPSVRKAATPVLDPVQERVKEATRRAKTSTVTVSLRMPQELNVWLDAYVHESWPERVKKQDLIIEALRMLIARRGKAGEPILSTELLPEDEG